VIKTQKKEKKQTDTGTDRKQDLETNKVSKNRKQKVVIIKRETWTERETKERDTDSKRNE
jgi:hypothetical protein